MGSIFQPDRQGRHPRVFAVEGKTVAHTDGREHTNEHALTHGYDGGVKPVPKHGTGTVLVAAGMHHIKDGKPVTGGGATRSYLDSVSGAIVPTPASGKVSEPGWGNSQARSGNPTVHPPGEKVLKPVAASFGQRSRTDEVGSAILKSALLGKSK